MSNNAMFKSVGAFLENLDGESNHGKQTNESCVDGTADGTFQPNQSHSSAAHFHANREAAARKKIVIFHLSEPIGTSEMEEQTDWNTVSQVFCAIKAEPLVGKICDIHREGDFDPDGEPRNLIVTFADENSQKIAVESAHLLASIRQFRHVFLQPYKVQSRQTETLNQSIRNRAGNANKTAETHEQWSGGWNGPKLEQKGNRWPQNQAYPVSMSPPASEQNSNKDNFHENVGHYPYGVQDGRSQRFAQEQRQAQGIPARDHQMPNFNFQNANQQGFNQQAHQHQPYQLQHQQQFPQMPQYRYGQNSDPPGNVHAAFGTESIDPTMNQYDLFMQHMNNFNRNGAMFNGQQGPNFNEQNPMMPNSYEAFLQQMARCGFYPNNGMQGNFKPQAFYGDPRQAMPNPYEAFFQQLMLRLGLGQTGAPQAWQPNPANVEANGQAQNQNQQGAAPQQPFNNGSDQNGVWAGEEAEQHQQKAPSTQAPINAHQNNFNPVLANLPQNQPASTSDSQYQPMMKIFQQYLESQKHQQPPPQPPQQPNKPVSKLNMKENKKVEEQNESDSSEQSESETESESSDAADDPYVSAESEQEDNEEKANEVEKPNCVNELFKAQSDTHNGAKKELNILVLGETGVGKSTWINAVANYVSFDTLEDALNAQQPVCLIPTKFDFYVNNGDNIEVKFNPPRDEKNDNEIFSKGQSSTQDPKTYQFETVKYIINIIDTPGIGDTRGVGQDKENTRKILAALGHYKQLHAICFLFKPNEARLTLSFKYRISEILLQLHKDAIDNIIFFFTNARGTFYKPGDTINPLNAFLSELYKDRGLKIALAKDKVFCTDNEAFRLLCAHFNGVKFSEEDFENFAGSWRQSAFETHRFIDFTARHLRAHSVSDTVSINRARTIIYTLAKPLADVNELIESNIKVADDRKRDLQNTAANNEALKKKLKVSQIGIEVKPLDYPKTVCTASKCTDTIVLPGTEQRRTIYNQICHDHCYLTGVDVEKVPEPHLRNCAAMRYEGNPKCQVCKCQWDTHMHIRFEQIKTVIQIEDTNTRTLIDKKCDAETVKKSAIRECENTITELKREQQKIVQTSLRFGSFLQANAILPYNDAFEKYVEQTISEEEKCTLIGGDRAKLESLQKQLKEYRQQKTMLEEARKKPTANGGNTITLDEIEVMKKELFTLKESGPILKQLFEATETGIATHQAHTTVKYAPPKQVQPSFFGKFKKPAAPALPKRTAPENRPSTSNADPNKHHHHKNVKDTKPKPAGQGGQARDAKKNKRKG